jgi:glycosyltransferase involved in cell wall biosynthesis
MKNRSPRPGQNLSSTVAGARILFMLHWLELGGTERQALLLARHLRENLGADVAVWGFEPPGRAAEMCDELRIPWRQVPFSFQGGRTVKVVGALRFGLSLRQFRPDVLLPYTMHPNLIAGLFWRFAGAQGCVWQQRDAGMMRRRGRIERRAVSTIPAFIANSTAGRLFLQHSLQVPADRIRVVLNGVSLPPPEEDRGAWRQRLGVGADTLLACMVANLHSYKDHETLLHAWRLAVNELRKHGPSPVLLLAGRLDNTHERLKALAFDLELGRSVRFLGAVKDVAGLLRAVDLGVFSSRHEGCPNGVLECMDAGLAVAATDIPGTRDALGEEGLSLLAPPGNAGVFAGNIARLLLDPSLRQEEGKRNSRRIEEVFTPDRMCTETTEVIAGLLRPKS